MRAGEAAARTLPTAACTAGPGAAAGDFPRRMKERRRISETESVMDAEEASEAALAQCDARAQSLNAFISLQARTARGFRMRGNTPIPSRMSELLSSDTEGFIFSTGLLSSARPHGSASKRTSGSVN